MATRIVIVGGGFAGATVAARLERVFRKDRTAAPDRGRLGSTISSSAISSTRTSIPIPRRAAGSSPSWWPAAASRAWRPPPS